MNDPDASHSPKLSSAAFDVSWPDVVTTPLVFGSPHSGRDYPPEFVASSRLSAFDLRRSEDCFVDEIFADVASLGAPLLRAHFPRAYVDVNREAYELDPMMFDEPLPSFVNTRSIRVASGLGTIARIVSENVEIYRDLLTFEEAKSRIANLYYPYHTQLEDLLKAARTTFGASLLVDCHSMPSQQPMMRANPAALRSYYPKRPDFVLGDRFGQSCPLHVTEFLEQKLRQLGYTVARNKPYAGGYITQKYGTPSKNSNCIQLEINRALYMDEVTLECHAGFDCIKEDLMEVFARLAVLTEDLLAAPRWAAE